MRELFATQAVVQQNRQNGAVTFSLESVGRWCRQQLACLRVAQRRRLAGLALYPWTFDTLDGVVRYGILVAEVFEQGCQRSE